MSRIGKQPIPLPSGVTVSVSDSRECSVKGPKGELSLALRPEVEVEVEGDQVLVKPLGNSRQVSAFHGMTRALVNNMVGGVTQGYTKTLEIHGVGWNAAVEGDTVVLNVGFSNPPHIKILAGISVQTPNPTTLIITGPDKQAVGQLAATIRKKRPPEPYKGKGIRYRGEYVRQKSGKSFGS